MDLHEENGIMYNKIQYILFNVFPPKWFSCRLYRLREEKKKEKRSTLDSTLKSSFVSVLFRTRKPREWICVCHREYEWNVSLVEARMTEKLTRDMRHVEVTDEYVHRKRKNTSHKESFSTRRFEGERTFSKVIAAKSTKRCRVLCVT